MVILWKYLYSFLQVRETHRVTQNVIPWASALTHPTNGALGGPPGMGLCSGVGRGGKRPSGAAGAGRKSVTSRQAPDAEGSLSIPRANSGHESDPFSQRRPGPAQVPRLSSDPTHSTHPRPSRYLSGGQGRSPFLPMPMFWDTATMQFSGRTMIAAENTSELAHHTDTGITR